MDVLNCGLCCKLAIKGEMMGQQLFSENTVWSESCGHSKMSPSWTSHGELHVLPSGVKLISKLLAFAISAIFSSVRAPNLYVAMTTIQSVSILWVQIVWGCIPSRLFLSWVWNSGDVYISVCTPVFHLSLYFFFDQAVIFVYHCVLLCDLSMYFNVA